MHPTIIWTLFFSSSNLFNFIYLFIPLIILAAREDNWFLELHFCSFFHIIRYKKWNINSSSASLAFSVLWLWWNCMHNVHSWFSQDVCFMLPPLLSLLLDCAKRSDQSVVSISLGALVHLIEVGGHQFSESDWDMLLKSIRCIT